MAMKAIENVTNYRMLEILPVEVAGKNYVQAKKGYQGQIDDIIYSVYPARDKDGSELHYQDGSKVMRVIAYVTYRGTEDYMTIKSDVGLSQLMSVTGPIDTRKEGRTAFKDPDATHVAITEVKQKFGDKEYGVPAFEVL